MSSKKKFLNGLEGGEVSTDKNGATPLYLRVMSFMEEEDENGKTVGDKINAGKLQAIDGTIMSTAKADKTTNFFLADTKNANYSNTNAGKPDHDFIWDSVKVIFGTGTDENPFIEEEAPRGFFKGWLEIKHRGVTVFKKPLSSFKREPTADGASSAYFVLNFPKFIRKGEEVTAEIKFLNTPPANSKVMLMLEGAEFIANGN